MFSLYYLIFQWLIWKATTKCLLFILFGVYWCLLVSCFFLLGDSKLSTNQEHAGLPRFGFYGSSLASLPSWLGMVNAGWLGSIWSEIVFANKIHHFLRLSYQTVYLPGKPVPYNQLLIQSLFLFQNANLLKILKLGFWNFKPIFLRMQVSLVATFFFSSFGYQFEFICASYTVS